MIDVPFAIYVAAVAAGTASYLIFLVSYDRKERQKPTPAPREKPQEKQSLSMEEFEHV
jgi:hypothetical protein